MDHRIMKTMFNSYEIGSIGCEVIGKVMLMPRNDGASSCERVPQVLSLNNVQHNIIQGRSIPTKLRLSWRSSIGLVLVSTALV